MSALRKKIASKNDGNILFCIIDSRSNRPCNEKDNGDLFLSEMKHAV
jgi:hypothetical protein